MILLPLTILHHRSNILHHHSNNKQILHKNKTKEVIYVSYPISSKKQFGGNFPNIYQLNLKNQN